MTSKPAPVSEKSVLTQVLEIYKEHAFLWDTSDSLYGNKGVKDLAVTMMLEKYKLLVPDANADTLRRRIDIMKTSFKREARKIKRNKKHAPTLWYYNLMTFLHEKSGDAAETSTTQPKEENEDSIEAYQPNPPKRTRPANELISENSNPEDSTFIISQPEIDENYETEAFGRTTGLQLRELGPMQKVIAEKLISDVIYYARLDSLTAKTIIANLKLK